MSLNIECEERVMISEEQYLKILEDVLRDNSDASFINQRNIYIDTPEFALRSSHRTLRIRSINGKFNEFTLKIKGSNGDKEYNQIISSIDVDNFMNFSIIPEGEIKDLLKSFEIDISSLKMITYLDTKRYEEKIDNYLLVVDKNNYSNITDYNLEIEASSKEEAVTIIKIYCDKYKIKYESCMSKSSRAILASKLKI